MNDQNRHHINGAPDSGGIPAAAFRALAALSPPGRILLASRAGTLAGVFASDDLRTPVIKLAAPVVEHLLALDWIAQATADPSIRKYRITAAGKAVAQRRPAKAAGASKPGRREAHFLAAERLFQGAPGTAPEKRRVNLGESPVGWLARRKGADGKPFLSELEVEAAERLRRDYERSQTGQHTTMDYGRLLAPSRASGAKPGREVGDSAIAARDRLAKAAQALGPGLWDAAYRTCCHHEGLERVETDLEIPARSGKAILRIALQQLVNVYGLAPKDSGSRPIQVWFPEDDAD